MFITDIYLANIEAVEILVVHPVGAAHSQLLYNYSRGQNYSGRWQASNWDKNIDESVKTAEGD